MTRDQLIEFFSLPQCDEQELFDDLEARAFSCAINGDREKCTTLIKEAAEIAMERLDREGELKQSRGGCDD